MYSSGLVTILTCEKIKDPVPYGSKKNHLNTINMDWNIPSSRDNCSW